MLHGRIWTSRLRLLPDGSCSLLRERPLGGSSQPSRSRIVGPGSSSPATRDSPKQAGGPPAGDGGGQEGGRRGRKEACPTDFPAEVSDIEQDRLTAAGDIPTGAVLAIELVGEDPGFLYEGELLGWLAVNIEEVTQCLGAGWLYRAEVRSNTMSPAGAIILTHVTGSGPGR
jgi:hypothetical protein